MRKRKYRIPHNEIFRNYITERDPNPFYRILRCDFEEEEDDEDEWH